MSTLASVVIRDLFANRPAAGIAGRLFFAYDTGNAYRDNGASWDAITAGGATDISDTGTFASATPSETGRLYLPSDSPVVLRDTGSAFGYWGPIFPLTTPPSVSSLTWVNQGSAAATNKNGGLFFTVPGASSTNITALVKAMPTPPYSLTVLFLLDNLTTNYAGAGIFVNDSSTGKIVTMGWLWSGPNLGVSYYNSPSSYNTQSYVVNGFYAINPLFFRLSDDGTNFKFAISANGFDFSNVLRQESRTAFLANPNQVGVFLDSENSHVMNMHLLHWSGI